MSAADTFREKSYWMITGEWMQQILPNATEEQPKPEPIMMRFVRTEYIPMHPAQYGLLAQGDRPNYAVLNQLQMTRRMYETVIDTIRGAQLQAAAEERMKLKNASQENNDARES